MALNVIDRAMQSFGAEGVSQDTFLARAWASVRTLRFADVGLHRFHLHYFEADHCFIVQGPDEARSVGTSDHSLC